MQTGGIYFFCVFFLFANRKEKNKEINTIYPIKFEKLYPPLIGSLINLHLPISNIINIFSYS